MVVLTAYATLKPECVSQGLDECRAVRAASVLEPGCERYDFFQSSDDETKVVFVEEWTSRDHLNTHFGQDAFQNFFAKMADLMAAPPEIRIFEAMLSE